MPGLMSGIERSINANVTDMFNSASSIVADDIYSYNGENFDGYQWIAALDKKTCLICAELDNQIFDLLPGMPGTGTEPPGIPPIHNSCRCVMAPVLKGMRDHPTQTAINYKDWFDRQSEKIKLDILGPSRYKEYLNGRAVTEFARDGRIMTLEELGAARATRKEILNAKNSVETEGKSNAIPMKDGHIAWEEIEERENFYAALSRVTGVPIENIDLDGMESNIRNVIGSEIERMFTKYPMLKDQVSRIGTSDEKGLWGRIQGGKNLFFGIERLSTRGSAKEEWARLVDSKSRYFPLGTDFRAVVPHELAHLLDHYLTAKSGKKRRYSELLRWDAQQHFGITFRDWDEWVINNLSRYAKQNAHEFMAEAMAEYHNMTDRGLTPREVARWVYERVTRDLSM